ncbi:MAG: exodeoxyribonuclease VII large subunit, partial [Candidatus Dormibacteraceae bacterium]
ARLVGERFRTAQRAVGHRAQRLAALSPDSVLARGYSITQEAESGRVLHRAAETGAGRRIRVRLSQGALGAVVEEAG